MVSYRRVLETSTIKEHHLCVRATRLFAGDSDQRTESATNLIATQGTENALEQGIGKTLTYGRRTDSSAIRALNLTGRTGPAPQVLPRVPFLKKGLNWLKEGGEIKMAIDTGLAAAEAVGCTMKQ
jgi:hypothetical protein